MKRTAPLNNKSSNVKLRQIREFAKDIIYMEANYNYTILHLVNGNHIMLSYTLKKLENEVKSFNLFERVHRSYLINTTYVNKRNRLEINLSNGITIPVARRRRLSKKNFEIALENASAF